MTDNKITAFHIRSRKYIIDILADIHRKNLELGELYEEFLRANDGNHNKAMNEFSQNAAVKKIVDELNGGCSAWYVKKAILCVILNGIESIVPENFHSLEEIKEAVFKACHEAKVSERKHFDISKEAETEIYVSEKKKFYDYIDHLSEGDLINTSPLFYRMVLSESRTDEIEGAIHTKWINKTLDEEKTLCFKEEDFREGVSLEKLKNIIKQLGVERIYEINTGGIDTASYLEEISAFDPLYIDGFNIFWCSEQIDWAIEKNHEGYYLIYGENLVIEIKKSWKDWESKIVSYC